MLKIQLLNNFHIFLIIIICVLFTIKNVNSTLCHSCDSNSSADCVEEQSPTGGTNCESDCYVRITENGETHRGCIEAIDETECDENDNCNRCPEDYCNFEIIPPNRLQCYQCTGVDCKTVTDPDIKVCRTFSASDLCYTYVDDNLETYRGCMSDINDQCTTMGDSCKICEEPTCNGQMSIEEPQLSCITCSSLDEKCAWGFPKTEAKTCTAPVPIPNTEQCYTKTNTDKTVERGCLLDKPNVCSDPDTCETCSELGCNNENVDYEICIQCNSDVPEEEFCAGDITNDEYSIICSTDIHEYEQRGCYKWNRNGVIERGCALNLEAADLENCKNEESANCEFCDENRKCNNGPAPQIAATDIQCYSCDSKDTPDCVNQQGTGDTTCEDGCYVRTTETGETVRGCVEELNANECDNGDDCHTCYTDFCNNEIFPNDRLKCYQCSNGGLCNDENLSAGPCLKYAKHEIDDETCYIDVQGGVIRRGCLDDIDENACTSGSTTCETCRGETCNDRVIILDQCISCTSINVIECISNVNNDWSKQCQYTLNSMGCYTSIDDENNVNRGCISELSDAAEIESCTNTLTSCKSCEGSNCNAKQDFQSCHVCNSEEIDNCATNLATIDTQICKNYYDECFVYIDGDKVTRGCAKEHSTLLEHCSDNNLCHLCEENNCNNKLLCIQCENCDQADDILEFAVLCDGDFETEKCYRLEDNDGNVHRGCLSSLAAEEFTICEEQNGNCKTCETDICNKKTDLQTCHVCNSEDDYNCVSNLNPIDTETCTDYMDTCRMLINEDGETHRGCTKDLQDIPCTEDDALCHTCAENNCNTGVFPIGRPRCYQCFGEDCETVTDLNFKVCHTLMEDERCYTYVDDNLDTYRGCMSDLNEATATCVSMGNSCVTCTVEEESETGCNGDVSVVDAKLSCIKCSGDDNACAWGYPREAAEKCSSRVTFLNSENCYTQTNPDGTVVRDCLLDKPDGCSNTANCAICDSASGCNNANVVFEICIQCNSSIPNEEFCADNITTNDRGSKCSEEIQAYEDRGCYKWNLGDGIIERGCASQLTNDALTDCKSTTFENCDFCDTARQCNDGPPPNNGNKIFESFISIILSIIMLQKYFN